jgi:hypothetical protein
MTKEVQNHIDMQPLSPITYLDKVAEIHAVRSSHGSQLFGLDFGDVIRRELEPMCLATCTRH